MHRIIFPLMFILLSGCANKHSGFKQASETEVISGDYWKSQALNDILPYWTKYSQDTIAGAFFTTLDSLWEPDIDQNKYPSMISRHLFSYSAGYLLSGNEEYISIAGETAKWLFKHAWDTIYGGWYDALDREGNPVQYTKSTFVQVYAITGLVMYYFVTHDKTAFDYIQKSNELLDCRVWDSKFGGYFNIMNRDWTINDSGKSFSSEITPVSGYLLYLYLATRKDIYLEQIRKILDITLERMIDKETGWILEDFDTEWNYIRRPSDGTEINTGHNIEAAWMFLRYYLLTGKEKYLKSGMLLGDKILQSGVFTGKNIWLSTCGRMDPGLKANSSYWWIQAYGNMFSLYRYGITGSNASLRNFVRGAEFWNQNFMDRKNGDTCFEVDSTGRVSNAGKANQFKTSYHSIEQCLLNSLYLKMKVDKEPFTLHFRITSSDDGEILFPSFIENRDIKISKIESNGQDLKLFNIEGAGIRLPALENFDLRVVLEN